MKKLERAITHGIYFLIVAGLGFFLFNTVTKVSEVTTMASTAIQQWDRAIKNVDECVGLLATEMLKSSEAKFPVARVTVTCYNSDPKQTDDTPHITAFNGKTGPGTLAVSRDLLELGFTPYTKVYLEGFGEFKVADVMNERFTKRVDIWVPKKAKTFYEEDVLLVGYCECFDQERL